MASIDGETLASRHLKELHDDSAISREQIAARGYTTEFNPRNLPPPFAGDQRRAGLLIPIRDTRGQVATWQLKPDAPRPGKGKYETPKGGRVCLDVPTAALPYLRDPEADLWLTEGAKKVDSAVCHGIPCTIGLLGVWMWRDGAKVNLPDWDQVALQGRRVIIAFDSDVMTNPKVRAALDGLAGFLGYRGAHVGYCLIPPREATP